MKSILAPLALLTALLSAAPLIAVRAQDAYPSVDTATQKARDDTRGQILQTELATEKKSKDQATAALASAVAGKQPQDKINALEQAVIGHEKNIEAIQGEIDGLDKVPSAKAAVVLRPIQSENDERPVPYWDVYRRPQPKPEQDVAPAPATSSTSPQGHTTNDAKQGANN